jgi:hypothetical protein
MTEMTLLQGDAAIAEGNALPGARRRDHSPQHRARMDEALRIFEAASTGSYAALARLQEALSTSDFTYVFGDVLDRELLTQYDQMPKIWPSFARRTTVKDFRAKKYVDLIGGRGILEKVPELDEYPQRKPTDAQYTLSVAKYGGRFSLSWEDMINDDLGALADLPNRLAQGAADTEDYIATQMLTDGTGPNDALFGAAVITNSDGSTASNLLTGNPALTTQSLSDALAAIGNRLDQEGRPVAPPGFALVVPPALEVAAMQIVNASSLILGADSSAMRVEVGNWLRGKITVVVNPWLPVIDGAANKNTTWYVVPLPSTARPSVVLGFLRGYETPDLRVKADAGSRVGGGAVDPREGSFEVDDIAYRVRHVIGSTTLDPRYAAVSNGSGS